MKPIALNPKPKDVVFYGGGSEGPLVISACGRLCPKGFLWLLFFVGLWFGASTFEMRKTLDDCLDWSGTAWDSHS